MHPACMLLLAPAPALHACCPLYKHLVHACDIHLICASTANITTTGAHRARHPGVQRRSGLRLGLAAGQKDGMLAPVPAPALHACMHATLCKHSLYHTHTWRTAPACTLTWRARYVCHVHAHTHAHKVQTCARAHTHTHMRTRTCRWRITSVHVWTWRTLCSVHWTMRWHPATRCVLCVCVGVGVCTVYV